MDVPATVLTQIHQPSLQWKQGQARLKLRREFERDKNEKTTNSINEAHRMENSETVIHGEQNCMHELMIVNLTCSFNANIYIKNNVKIFNII